MNLASIAGTVAWTLVATALTQGCSAADIPVVDERSWQSERKDGPTDGGLSPDSEAPPSGEAGAFCAPNPPATYDVDPSMASTLCGAARTDCLVCVQCADSRGNALVDYVISSYGSSCACPFAPTPCRDAQ